MRDKLGIRRDAWYEYVPDPTSQADNSIVERLSNTVLFLSEVCYSRCITPKMAKAAGEDKCIKGCVDDYFSTFKELTDEAKMT